MKLVWWRSITGASAPRQVNVLIDDRPAGGAAFKFIGAALGATPTQLGQITLSRALVQAASSPMAGLLGDRLDRVHLIATGCLLWAACTAAIGMSRTLLEASAAPCYSCVVS